MGVVVLVLPPPAPKEMVRLLPSSLSAIPALNLRHHVALRQVLLVLVQVREEIVEGLLHPGAFCVLILPRVRLFYCCWRHVVSGVPVGRVVVVVWCPLDIR